MAIAVVMEFDGGTLEQYDQVIDRMGLENGGPAPEGALFHWVTLVDGGFRVTDVWETREAFDSFAQEKIGPITAEVGIPGPPRMSFFEVHSYVG
jgi:hypothetical protein